MPHKLNYINIHSGIREFKKMIDLGVDIVVGSQSLSDGKLWKNI